MFKELDNYPSVLIMKEIFTTKMLEYFKIFNVY